MYILADLYTTRFRYVLKRIRKTVKLFRKSPVKNAILQEKIINKFHKSYQLCADVKTRWNSTEGMLERFIKTFDCIKDALADIGLTDLILDSDLDVAKSLFEALQPIRLASEALGRRDATLLSAEGTLSFLYTKLKESGSTIGHDLYDAITNRINQRRNKELVTTLKYLQGLPLSSIPDLENSSKSQMTKFIKEHGVRLIRGYLKQIGEVGTDAEPIAGPSSRVEVESGPSNLREELESAIKVFVCPGQPDAAMIDIAKVITKELSLFELHGRLSRNLKILFDALNSIKPTSTDSERVFSDSANICSKKRTLLADTNVNNLCFLKSYFARIDSVKI